MGTDSPTKLTVCHGHCGENGDQECGQESDMEWCCRSCDCKDLDARVKCEYEEWMYSVPEEKEGNATAEEGNATAANGNATAAEGNVTAEEGNATAADGNV